MTSDFKQILEVRSENLRESKSRREQFSQGAVTHSMPQMDGYPAGQSLQLLPWMMMKLLHSLMDMLQYPWSKVQP